jgi:hypothetical protein
MSGKLCSLETKHEPVTASSAVAASLLLGRPCLQNFCPKWCEFKHLELQLPFRSEEIVKFKRTVAA